MDAEYKFCIMLSIIIIILFIPAWVVTIKNSINPDNETLATRTYSICMLECHKEYGLPPMDDTQNLTQKRANCKKECLLSAKEIWKDFR